MDPGQSEYYEFLDLTDIDESERYQLNNTLFPSEQSSHDLSDSGVWNEGTFESDRLSTLNSGSSVPPSESDFSMNGDHQAISPQFGVGSQCPQTNAPMYGAPYNMQQAGASHMYQMMQPTPLSNVYVGNVTANVNVHGYMGHYIPFMTQGPVEQVPEMSSQRPTHSRDYNPRGRRNRGGHNKRDYQHQTLRSQQCQQQQIQPDMEMQQQQQANAFQYMPVPYQSAYYHPSAPQSHLAQHATGSPIYVGQHLPMYATMPHLYQFHPGMVFSPVGMPPEYQLMDPSVKLDNGELDMYQQTSDVTQQMVGMNIQGEELYHCMPTILPNQEMSEYPVNQNSGIVLEECSPDEGVLNKEKEREVDIPSVSLVNTSDATASVPLEAESVDLPKNYQGVKLPQPVTVSISPSTNVSTVDVTVSDTVANQEAISSAPKLKAPFVNNKDIVKTGISRKSTNAKQSAAVLQNKAMPVSQSETNACNILTPQPQEVQKLQAVKLSDARPKSQTPPNSVWVNNQLYTPPSSDTIENSISNQKAHSSTGLIPSNENAISHTKLTDVNSKYEDSILKSTSTETFGQLQTDTKAAAAPSQNKSWASLFNKSDKSSISVISINTEDSNSVTNSVTKPVAVVQPLENSSVISLECTQITNNQKVNQYREVVNSSSNQTQGFLDDPSSYRAGEFLTKYNLDNRTISLQPRGLTNRSNYCYINSTLQALVACPPLYNLLKALPHQVKKGKSSTPVIDAMTQLAYEFSPLPPGARVGRREKGHQRKDELPDVSCGPTFEPLAIHRMLNSFHPNIFQVEGRQEDAEEFLSCLLNGLNDEMVELIKLVEPEEKAQVSNGNLINGHANCDVDDDDDWKVMGPKNKGSITRRSYFGRSPISDIFRGQLRSRVQRAGDLTTDSVQPFFTLQLDIEKAGSVSQALELLVGRDQLEGVTCSKTNQEIEAWQQVTLEELPVVLILHLKWFDYKLDGCTKIVKTVEFPIDLKIDSKIMSSKIKYTAKQRQYKLFAVVYHDGKEASKGHYITDVFHVGFNGWIRYDDSVVKAVTENMVLHPRQPRVPYLLYYRRCDTIGPSNNINSRTH